MRLRCGFGFGRAEVGLDDGGVFADFFWGAGGDGFAVVEDEDALADAHDDFHVVLDEGEGGRMRAQRGKQMECLAHYVSFHCMPRNVESVDERRESMMWSFNGENPLTALSKYIGGLKCLQIKFDSFGGNCGAHKSCAYVAGSVLAVPR